MEVRKQFMLCSDYENLLQEYIDRQLERSKEPELFGHLAQCAGCRKNFDLYSAIHRESKNQQEKYPAALDEKIFSSIKNRTAATADYKNARLNKRPVNVLYFYSAVASIILLLVYELYSFNEFDRKNQIQEAHFMKVIMEMKFQEDRINRLIDRLPAARVRAQVDAPTVKIKNLQRDL